MRQTTADRAAIADREMPDMRNGVGKDRKMLSDKRRGLNLEMPRQRPDADAVWYLLDKTEARNTIDIDEN